MVHVFGLIMTQMRVYWIGSCLQKEIQPGFSSL